MSSPICMLTKSNKAACENDEITDGVVNDGCAGCEYLLDGETIGSLRARVVELEAEVSERGLLIDQAHKSVMARQREIDAACEDVHAQHKRADTADAEVEAQRQQISALVAEVERLERAAQDARRAGRAEGLREANEKHGPLLAAAKALLDEIEWQGDRPFTSRVKFARYRELDAAVAALLARAEEVEREQEARGIAGDRCEAGNECGRAGCPECQQ